MQETQSIDLLVDPASTVFAVHCIPTEDELSIGALYVAPNNPFGVIRLSDRAARFDVELPPELVNSKQFIAVWNVKLPIIVVDND
jgi:hypothetical protein